ncbi:MAG TPA: MarR family transcriptional regulator [Kofleriaceae bacterium]|nr:MarR family transcriptional regulator [Kofleriaceae bacterium]
MKPDLARRVQRAYPQLYLACHVRHAPRSRQGRARGDRVTRGGKPHGLNERDGAVLAHLDELSPVTAGRLAKHLGVGASTVTEAIDHLEQLGLATRSRNARDKRQIELRITRDGVKRMRDSSVLSAERLDEVLAQIPAARRAAAVRGLELLAEGARAAMKRRK